MGLDWLGGKQKIDRSQLQKREAGTCYAKKKEVIIMIQKKASLPAYRQSNLAAWRPKSEVH